MKHLKEYKNWLFENHDVYQNSLEDEYWKNIGDKFPDYNNPDSEDHKNATEYIYSEMKKKYADEDWDQISKSIKSSIAAGIS